MKKENKTKKRTRFAIAQIKQQTADRADLKQNNNNNNNNKRKNVFRCFFHYEM